MYYAVYVSFDFEVNVFGQVSGNLAYFATWEVADKSELNTSSSIRYKLYLIDADELNSNLFSNQFNEEKQLWKVFIYYSISSVYFSNLFKLSFTFSKFAKCSCLNC